MDLISRVGVIADGVVLGGGLMGVGPILGFPFREACHFIFRRLEETRSLLF